MCVIGNCTAASTAVTATKTPALTVSYQTFRPFLDLGFPHPILSKKTSFYKHPVAYLTRSIGTFKGHFNRCTCFKKGYNSHLKLFIFLKKHPLISAYQLAIKNHVSMLGVQPNRPEKFLDFMFSLP